AAIHSQLDRVHSGLCQLHNAMWDVKDIQNSLAEDTPLMIEQAELLEGHHKLMNLECSWNDFMHDQYRMGSKNTHKMNLIRNYFGKVEGLSDDLVKQLWIVLHRAMGKAGGHSEQ
ncbi:unnamed protein product, partial [Coregonus sp. 'balchen']